MSNHIVGNLNEDKNMEKNIVTELVQTIKKLKTHMSGFVDDTRNSVIVSNKSHQNSPKLCKLLQHTAQSWDHLLSTSGGKLNSSKCVFCIIQWSFNSNGTSNIGYKSTF